MFHCIYVIQINNQIQQPSSNVCLFWNNRRKVCIGNGFYIHNKWHRPILIFLSSPRFSMCGVMSRFPFFVRKLSVCWNHAMVKNDLSKPYVLCVLELLETSLLTTTKLIIDNYQWKQKLHATHKLISSFFMSNNITKITW